MNGDINNNDWWIRTKPSPVKSNSLSDTNQGTLEFNWKRLFGLLLSRKAQ